MKLLKKYWWVIAAIVILIAVVYISGSGIQETSLTSVKAASSGGSILK